eukprot:2940973-Prymnesium_polylepis.1
MARLRRDDESAQKHERCTPRCGRWDSCAATTSSTLSSCGGRGVCAAGAPRTGGGQRLCPEGSTRVGCAAHG